MLKAEATPNLLNAWSGHSSTHGGESYAELITKLRGFLDAVASSKPDVLMTNALSKSLDEWTRQLTSCSVEEMDQVYARRNDLVGRGQVTWPAIRFTHLENDFFEGFVTFGRYYLGRNGVVHGGAIMLVFDEAAGRLAHLVGQPLSRTAYLRTDFRNVTPIDVELALRGRYISKEGRKRILHLGLYHGEKLCAEADALMVTLQPGQQ